MATTLYSCLQPFAAACSHLQEPPAKPQTS